MKLFNQTGLRQAGALCLLAGLMAGCGGMGAPASTATPTAPAPTATPTITPTATPRPTPTLDAHLQVSLDDLRGQKVVFAYPWQGALDLQARSLLDEFNRSNEWGIQARALALGGMDEVEALLQSDRPSAGVDADDALVAAASSASLAAYAGEDNRVVLLDDYVAHPDYGLTVEQQEDYLPAYWRQDVTPAGRAGLPLLRGGTALFYNQTWAQELGFDAPPTTPNEFRSQACAAAQANNALGVNELAGTGGWIQSNDADALFAWLAAFGAQPLPAAGERTYHFSSPEAVEAFEFLRGLAEQGCAWQSRLSQPYDYFATRLALFYSGTLNDLDAQTRAMARNESGDTWLLLAYPGLDGAGVTISGGESLGVAVGSARQQMAAWLLARWLAQPRPLALLAQAGPGFPVSGAAQAQLTDYHLNPPWDRILPLQAAIRPAPTVGSWRIARPILSDAGFQLFQSQYPSGQIPSLLQVLDQMIEEVQRQ